MRIKIFTDPDAFFREEVQDVSTGWPILIVCIAALANASSPVAWMYLLMSTAPEGASAILLFSGVIGILVGSLMMFALWLIYALVLHGLSRYFGGRGSLRRTALLSSWGFLPNILSGLFGGFASYLVAGDLLAGGGLQSGGVQDLSAGIEAHPALTIAMIVAVVGLLWRAIIWTFAIKHGHDLSLDRSVTIVAVPTIGAVLMTVLL